MQSDSVEEKPEIGAGINLAPDDRNYTLEDPMSLALFLESAPIAIVTIDINGRILYVNSRLSEMFGYAPGELLGQKIEALIPERFRSLHLEHRSGFLENPHVRSMGSNMDLTGRRRTGSEFPIEVGLSYVHVNGAMLIMATVTDISRRKQVEDLLESRVQERTRELEQRRRVSEGLRDTLAILNSNHSLDEILDHIVLQATQLLYADASAIYSIADGQEALTLRACYGITETQLKEASAIVAASSSGETVLEYRSVSPDLAADSGSDHASSPDHASDAQKGRTLITTIERPRWNPTGQALMETGYQALLSVPLLVKDAGYGSLMLYYSEPRKFSPEEIELALSVGDQAALAIENARLRSQVERTAVTAERNRIARDLHDSVTQTLFSATLIAEVLPKLWKQSREESERRLEELRQLTRGALAEMRTLLLELRPATLIEVEIGELLRQLTEATTGRTRAPVTLSLEGSCQPPPDVKIAFYHIAQEALNNVAKHARAGRASVHLQCYNDHFELAVGDDGRGFVLSEVTAEHLGLTIMRERAEDIGASLHIESGIDEGTVISVVWPSVSPTDMTEV
jgi:PAS domain S-box-containing protein